MFGLLVKVVEDQGLFPCRYYCQIAVLAAQAEKWCWAGKLSKFLIFKMNRQNC